MREINLNHICKIEGHADLSLKIENNKVKKCELQAVEGARFFEGLVLGKNIEDIQEIVSRICGICSCAHSVAAVQAIEEALGIKASEQQKIIREMLMIGERIRSHATHLYFMALPDYYNVSSVLLLKDNHKEKIDDALKLITIGNQIVELFGGREIHPFLSIKEKLPFIKFEDLRKKLDGTKDIVIRCFELFKSFEYPDFERIVDYLSLKDTTYASISGKITSSSGSFIDEDYKKHLKENLKEYATSKFVLKDGKVFQTGAIARLNNNIDLLSDEIKDKFRDFNMPFRNPYFNNVAQAIELLIMYDRAIELIDNFNPLSEGVDYKIKAGTGISAVEAPRGTLFHEYRIRNDGKIDYCNIITPTAQNLNMIEKDITFLVDSSLESGFTKKKIVDNVEKLIRAYDPCFSCSSHFLRVKWL